MHKKPVQQEWASPRSPAAISSSSRRNSNGGPNSNTHSNGHDHPEGGSGVGGKNGLEPLRKDMGGGVSWRDVIHDEKTISVVWNPSPFSSTHVNPLPWDYERNHQPSTINHQPSTPNHKASTHRTVVPTSAAAGKLTTLSLLFCRTFTRAIAIPSLGAKHPRKAWYRRKRMR